MQQPSAVTQQKPHLGIRYAVFVTRIITYSNVELKIPGRVIWFECERPETTSSFFAYHTLKN